MIEGPTPRTGPGCSPARARSADSTPTTVHPHRRRRPHPRRRRRLGAAAGRAGGQRIGRKPSVWSTLEYGCHIRDVHRIFNDRVRLMLDEDEPLFPNWDQDETAIEPTTTAPRIPPSSPSELSTPRTSVADTYTRRTRRRMVTARTAQQRQRVHGRIDRDLSLARHRSPRARCRPWLKTLRWQARSPT